MYSKAVSMLGMEINYILGFCRPPCEEDMIMWSGHRIISQIIENSKILNSYIKRSCNILPAGVKSW
jgi:hypothetical protein